MSRESPVELRPPAGRRLTYIPEIDGLRALGVAVVVIHHAIDPIVNGGFVGVDIFFVISGFLITTILLNEFDYRGGISLRSFYLRRIVRLYPALLICAAVIAVPGFFLAGWQHVRSTFYALLYLTPVTAILDPASPGAWAHTWSLGIEEMFYILWPLSLLFFLRRTRPPVALGITVGLGIALLLLFLVTDGTMLGSFLRSGGIFIGCGIAMWLRYYEPPRLPQWSAWSALAALLVTAVVGGSVFTRGVSVLVAVLCTTVLLLVIVHGREPGVINRLLSARPIVYLGRISYEFYLWHYAILLTGLWAAGPQSSMLELAWWAVPLSFAASVLTYHGVKPLQDRLRHLVS